MTELVQQACVLLSVCRGECKSVSVSQSEHPPHNSEPSPLTVKILCGIRNCMFLRLRQSQRAGVKYLCLVLYVENE